MTMTSAFYSIVGDDHRILLPKSVPVGTKVAVVLFPSEAAEAVETARNHRFQAVLDAVRSAMHSDFPVPTITNEELNRLIREARQNNEVS